MKTSNIITNINNTPIVCLVKKANPVKNPTHKLWLKLKFSFFFISLISKKAITKEINKNK